MFRLGPFFGLVPVAANSRDSELRQREVEGWEASAFDSGRTGWSRRHSQAYWNSRTGSINSDYFIRYSNQMWYSWVKFDSTSFSRLWSFLSVPRFISHLDNTG